MAELGQEHTISRTCPAPLARKCAWCVSGFEFIKPVGRGACSAVYLARCCESGIQCVLKAYYKAQLTALNMHQVAREAQIHSTLSHSNILQMWGAFEDDEAVYLVLEHASKVLHNTIKVLSRGPELACTALLLGDVYSTTAKRGGCFSEEEAVTEIMYPFLLALKYLHDRSIVHRDIKPENLLLTADGVLKVADFGLALNAAAERPVTRVGTLDYMAPEVIRCPEKYAPHENKHRTDLGYSHLVDMWAAGVLAYELLVGRAPFDCGSKSATVLAIQERDPQFPMCVSEQARDFISRALVKDARDRPCVLDLLEHDWIRMHVAGSRGAGHNGEGGDRPSQTKQHRRTAGAILGYNLSSRDSTASSCGSHDHDTADDVGGICNRVGTDGHPMCHTRHDSFNPESTYRGDCDETSGNKRGKEGTDRHMGDSPEQGMRGRGSGSAVEDQQGHGDDVHAMDGNAMALPDVAKAAIPSSTGIPGFTAPECEGVHHRLGAPGGATNSTRSSNNNNNNKSACAAPGKGAVVYHGTLHMPDAVKQTAVKTETLSGATSAKHHHHHQHMQDVIAGGKIDPATAGGGGGGGAMTGADALLAKRHLRNTHLRRCASETAQKYLHPRDVSLTHMLATPAVAAAPGFRSHALKSTHIKQEAQCSRGEDTRSPKMQRDGVVAPSKLDSPSSMLTMTHAHPASMLSPARSPSAARLPLARINSEMLSSPSAATAASVTGNAASKPSFVSRARTLQSAIAQHPDLDTSTQVRLMAHLLMLGQGSGQQLPLPATPCSPRSVTFVQGSPRKSKHNGVAAGCVEQQAQLQPRSPPAVTVAGSAATLQPNVSAVNRNGGRFQLPMVVKSKAAQHAAGDRQRSSHAHPSSPGNAANSITSSSSGRDMADGGLAWPDPQNARTHAHNDGPAIRPASMSGVSGVTQPNTSSPKQAKDSLFKRLFSASESGKKATFRPDGSAHIKARSVSGASNDGVV